MEILKADKLNCFAALLKIVPTGCKDAVLQELLLRNCTINCLTSGKKTKQPQTDNLCLCWAFALKLQENHWLAEKNLEIFTSSVKRMDGLSPNQFKGVHMNDISVAEDLLTLNNLLYDIDIVGWNNLGENAGRSAQKYENTAGLLRYNDHICYARNINAVFQSFRSPSCNAFFIRIFTLERHSTTCNERVKQYLFENCLWKPRTSLWQAGLFRYQVPKSTKTFRELRNFWFWIKLCPR